MTYRIEQINGWKKKKEVEALEFKEAKSDFGFETLHKYVVALANERGGEGSIHLVGVRGKGRWHSGSGN